MLKFKRFRTVFLWIAALAFCTSCAAQKAKVFSKAGMSITLTEAFTESKYYNLTAYYESEDNTVSVIKEEFSVLENAGISTSLSLAEYAKTFLTDNQIEAEVKTEDGLTYFTFEKTIEDVAYTYYAVAFKSSDSYWLFQFTCEKEAYSKYSNDFVKWAQSVQFE